MKTHQLSFTLLVALLTFVELFGQTQEVRLFSHRGGRMENDENTLKAFKASYDAGYRGFETDIRMTKDGELVIHMIVHWNGPLMVKVLLKIIQKRRSCNCKQNKGTR